MSLAIIILIPILCAFGFLYWASQLEEDDEILKLMFRLLYLPLIWISAHFAVIDVAINYGSNDSLVSLLSMFVYYLGWVFFIIGAYVVMKLLLEIKDWFVAKKEKKMEEKYG